MRLLKVLCHPRILFSFIATLVLAAAVSGQDSTKPAVSTTGAEPAAPEKKDESPPPPDPTAYMEPTKDGGDYPDPTGGKAGVWTTPRKGTAEKSVGDGDPSKLTNADLYHRISHNMISINMMWVLIGGFLVMFMQAGFMLVETGLCRAKNSAHTSAMNLMIYPLGCLAFWAYGFAIGWGNWWNAPVAEAWYSPIGGGTVLLDGGIGTTYGLMGTKGWFLQGFAQKAGQGNNDVSVIALFFFMMVFMDTTATIPTGSMAERWSWKNFCLFGLWVALPYCLYANWVWGGGWLAQSGVNWGLGHGAVDFAGSGVVHSMGGVIALVGAIVIGPRIGKYVDGKPIAIPGHNIPMVVAGTFILAFGWFGFNAGSTLSGTDLRISVIVVNTMLASVTGALASMVVMMIKGMKPDPSMMCNGMLAGLVAITAPCAFVDTWAAALIGAIGGALVVFSVFFWDRMGVDDPVGAVSVHGVNGIWGVISVGLFANGEYGDGLNKIGGGVRGLFYNGGPSQLYAQLLSAATVLIFGGVMAFVWFKISNLITPLRVSKEVELEGLDGPEMGSHGYPDFQLAGEA